MILNKWTKIWHNLRALHKFTRLQTRRNRTFKERSASTQHKLSTCRRINNSNVFENINNSFFKNINDNSIVSNRKFSNRKFSNLHSNDFKSIEKRNKKYRFKSSSSALSTKLSTEFYLEYFRILQSIQQPNFYNNTLSTENISPHKITNSKGRKGKGSRPKSAPDVRKVSKVNKGRRGTVDPDRVTGISKSLNIWR